MSSFLEYDATAVAGGELWRIITCHIVHWSPSHLAWDCGAFVLLLALAWRAGIPARHIVLAVALAAIAIPLALPGIARYRGLSGIDSALFAMIAGYQLVDRSVRVVALLALLGFLAKIVFEISTGAALFVPHLGAGVVPVPMAHLVGALAGVTSSVAARIMNHATRRAPDCSPRVSSARRHARKAGHDAPFDVRHGAASGHARAARRH